MTSEKSYSIGLDIGTGSVGWAVVDQNNKVISKKFAVRGNTDKKSIKKNMIGTLLFDGAEPAEVRRLKRTSRRRITRRRKRIEWLQEIFALEMAKVDDNFFRRLDESFYHEDDKKFEKYPVFKTLEEEKQYHKNFKTIYHLRKALADSDEKVDLRLVYLALAHIIKYRGHFLLEGDIESNERSLDELFKQFINEYIHIQTNAEKETNLVAEANVDIQSTIKEKVSKSRKAELILSYLNVSKKEDLLVNLVRMIVGLEGSFKKCFSLEEDAKIKISADDYEEKLENLLSTIGEEYRELFTLTKSIHDTIVLSDIVSGADLKTKAKLSSAMINRFVEHKKDLADLKSFIKGNLEDKYKEVFKDKTKNGYAGYIKGKTKEQDFYDYLKKLLNGIDGAEGFLEKIGKEDFLRKQRTYDNGVIPNQLHLKELEAILENQGKNYPFLKENSEKIKKLLTFRIPYYVGPLADEKSSEFAWVVKYSDDKVTPWNFDEVVDETASAAKFIERMTKNCQYLPEEKVLPRKSLIYEKYTILNELTKVRYEKDGQKKVYLSSEQKEKILENIFKKQVKVKAKDIENFLKNEYNLVDISIKGLDEKTGKFNSSFTTYHDLRRLDSLAKIIDDEAYEDIIENIIKTLTLFDDRKIIKEQLEKYSDIISGKDITALSKKRYIGWGNLSKKLLVELYDEVEGKNIIDFLMDDEYNRNFMQLINADDLSFKDELAKAITVKNIDDYHAVVNELPGSPAIKKGILNSLKIVDEIVNIMGSKPDNIVIEMAREVQATNRLPQRLSKLQGYIKGIGSDILKKYPVTNAELQSEKLYLYYLQDGKDMYRTNADGSPVDLNISDLSSYDVDHIIPQSITKDNSFDNKVLTNSKDNRGKSGDVPSLEVVKRMRPFWEKLKKAGAISERKFSNLTKAERGGLSEDDKSRFIARQLVETRQITKHVASILDEKYNAEFKKNKKEDRDVNVITLKAEMVSHFRKEFELYKVRDLNDLHHAHDAYLAVLVAKSLLKSQPKLKADFVYGEYKTYQNYGSSAKADARRRVFNKLLGFFSKEVSPEEIVEGLKFDKSFIDEHVEKVLYKHQINVVRKTIKNNFGKFYGESLISRESNEKELLPYKNDLDTKKYGGYKDKTTAYAVWVYGKIGGKIKRDFVTIPILYREKFEKNPIEYLLLQDYAEVYSYHVIPKFTLIEYSDSKKYRAGTRRFIVSGGAVDKANQFGNVDRKVVNFLYHAMRYNEINNPESYEYINNNFDTDVPVIFETIISFIAKNKLVAKEKNIENLKTVFYDNYQNDRKTTLDAIVNLLNISGLKTVTGFNFFGEKIKAINYGMNDETKNATLIHQSITGLYETRIDMSKLGEK